MLNPKEEAVLKLIAEDSAYENYFFNKVTNLKWFYPLKKKGYFNPKNSPLPQPAKEGFCSIPYWNVLTYLERVSEETKKRENEQYADELLQIIRDVTNYQDAKAEKIDNYHTRYAFTKILVNLPSEKISTNDLHLIKKWLESKFDNSLVTHEITKNLLPKFLNSDKPEDWQKAEEIVKVITKLREVEQSSVSGIIDAIDGKEPEKEKAVLASVFELWELFEKHGKLLGKRCNKGLIYNLIRKIKELIVKNDEFSYVWLESLGELKKGVSSYTSSKVLIFGLTKLLSAKAIENPEETKEILLNLSKEKFNILKRLCLFIIDKDYENFKDILWAFIKPEHFRDSNLRDELATLLKNHFDKIGEGQNKIVDFIKENVAEDIREDLEDRERWKTLLKQEWLSLLIDKNYPKADELYKEYKAITQTDVEFCPRGLTRDVDLKQFVPINVEGLLQKSNKQIVDYLNNFKSSMPPVDEDLLGDVFKDTVKAKPGKFIDNLNPFLKLKPQYLREPIYAFTDLWKEKKVIHWKSILGFCYSIVRDDDESFWKDTSGYRNSVSSAISYLIETGTRDDSWAFLSEYLSIAEKILLEILKKQESGMSETKDAYSKAINTAKGRVTETLINYALRYARVNYNKPKDKDKPKWRGKEVKDIFLSALNKEDDSLEFSVLMGRYLPNLFHLDRELFTNEINKIFPKDNSNHWNVAMQGYLWGHRVYDDLYKLLRKNNHYLKALQERFEDRYMREKLIEHICIGYLRDFESLSGKDSLFVKLLDEWQQEDIRDIISFFWGIRKEEADENIRNHILDFRKFSYNKLKNKEITEDDKKILSDMNLLAIFLEDLKGERKEWLLQSVPYVDINHHSSFLIEYLDRLTDENPKEVGKIFVKMLESGVTPFYDEEHIISIVNKLYKKGEKKSADRIANIYGSRMISKRLYETMKKLWEENQREKVKKDEDTENAEKF